MFRTLAMTTTALLGLAHGTAQACTCMPPSIETSFDGATDSIIVRIEGQKRRGDTLYYSARVLRTFKGCTERGDKVILSTPADSSACGETALRARNSILVFGHSDGTWGDRPVLDINICDYNTKVRNLTTSDKRFLVSHVEECADECTSYDPEGFGSCDMFLGWGLSSTTDACEPLSGCGLPPEVTLFESLGECQEACIID